MSVLVQYILKITLLFLVFDRNLYKNKFDSYKKNAYFLSINIIII